MTFGEGSFVRGGAKNTVIRLFFGRKFSTGPRHEFGLGAGFHWLDASVGDYSGGIINSSVGVNFQLLKHLGLGLSYQYFRLNVDVDSDDWNGAAELNYRGPFLSLTTNW